MRVQSFDIVIIGGGMVGATLALALSRSSYRVAVIEAVAMQSQQHASFDDRAIALSWGSRCLLNQLSVWPALQSQAAAIQQIHVSDRGQFGLTHIRADEEGVPALGFVVTARTLGAAIMPALPTNQDGLQIFSPARLQDIAHTDAAVNIVIDNDNRRESIATRLLVAADGAQSMVRQLLAITASQKHYQQHAVIANITPGKPHDGIAFERFTDQGPIALLPMVAHRGESRCALVWTLPEAQTAELLLASDADFLRRLQSRFGYRLGYFKSVGKRSSYPLSLVTNPQHAVSRVVFIGNAAQTLHPVAGQGFNLALRDTATLLDCLLYPQLAEDPGAAGLLEQFYVSRRRDRRRVIYFTDGLIDLFSNNNPVLRQLRSSALMALDTLPSIRRLLARHAMGLNMPMPHI